MQLFIPIIVYFHYPKCRISKWQNNHLDSNKYAVLQISLLLPKRKCVFLFRRRYIITNARQQITVISLQLISSIFLKGRGAQWIMVRSCFNKHNINTSILENIPTISVQGMGTFGFIDWGNFMVCIWFSQSRDNASSSLMRTLTITVSTTMLEFSQLVFESFLTVA